MTKKKLGLGILVLSLLFMLFPNLSQVKAIPNSIVASGDVYSASERHEAFTQNRFWVIYLSSGNLYMKSSIDGSSWSSASIVADETNNIVYWDCYIKYGDSAFASFYFETTTNKYWFKKGILFSNGTLSLSVGVLVYDASTYDAFYPSINKDSNGIFWCASGMDTSAGTYRYRIYSSPDGITFTNRLSYDDGGTGFNERYVNTQILSWSNGSVYFMCADYSGASIKYWIWSNSLSAVQSHTLTNLMQTSVTKEDKFSADIDGNNLMSFTWIKNGGANYYKSFDGITWSSETNLDSATTNYVCISIDGINTIRTFWIKSNIIYMKVYNGSWQTTQTPFGTTFSTPTALNIERQSLYYCSVSWKEGTNIIFNYIVTKTYLTTFRFSNIGKFVVNGIIQLNGTQTRYILNTNLRLEGLPNTEFVFLNFSWSSGSSTINFYNYTVSSDNTIWCYFRNSSYYYNLGYLDGYSVGYALGFNTGNSTGYILGNSTGYALGYSIGYSVGYAQGYIDGGSGGGIDYTPYAIIIGIIISVLFIIIYEEK